MRKQRNTITNPGLYQHHEVAGNTYLTAYAATHVGTQLAYALNSYGLRRHDMPVEISRVSCGGEN